MTSQSGSEESRIQQVSLQEAYAAYAAAFDVPEFALTDDEKQRAWFNHLLENVSVPEPGGLNIVEIIP